MAGLLPRQVEHSDGRRVELHLGRVAARLTPGDEGVGVADLGALGVVERVLGGPQPVACCADGRRGEREGEVGKGVVAGIDLRRADELAHDAQPAAACDRAGRRGDLARDHPQQRRLARPVGPDERHAGAFADAEADVREQLAAVGQDVPDGHRLDVAHEEHMLGRPYALVERIGRIARWTPDSWSSTSPPA